MLTITNNLKSRVAYHGDTSHFFGIGISWYISDTAGIGIFRSVLLYCKIWRVSDHGGLSSSSPILLGRRAEEEEDDDGGSDDGRSGGILTLPFLVCREPNCQHWAL